MKNEMVMTTASKEWATRPDDQRFTSLEELHASVSKRRTESWTAHTASNSLRILPSLDEQGVEMELYDPTIGDKRRVNPTHWSFSQLAGYSGAPAAYLRKLPAPLAAINLQWGLENIPVRDEVLILGQSNGDNRLRAMTSLSYGRIWDKQVVEAVQRVNQDNRWVIPAASYTTKNPKRATTLYASDRDVFIFLVDPKNAIEVNGEQLFRGFIVWNSEVGASVFGLTTFLYRYVCDNRMIWGATDIKELRIRHMGGAPERFAYEGRKYLERYSQESTAGIASVIAAADKYEIQEPEGKGKGWETWLTSRGFTANQARMAVASAKAEEGEARSLWDIVNGITAYARQISHTDERVKLETQAGALLNIVR